MEEEKDRVRGVERWGCEGGKGARMQVEERKDKRVKS